MKDTRVLLLLVLCSGFASSPGLGQGERSLSFEERVAAQTAIERVYWAHRIWPKENLGPKPALEAAMPESAVRAKVEDYLLKSSALETWWGRPITAELLQAELERMAKHSRDPLVLQELFDALGGDPFLIAECLARPVLSDRLARSRYGSDERIHGALRREIVADLERVSGRDGMKRLGGEYAEITWQRAAAASGEAHTFLLDEAEWMEVTRQLDSASGLQEDADSFFVTAVLAREDDSVRVATVSWPKRPLEAWLLENVHFAERARVLSADAFSPVSLRASGCTDDTWTRSFEDVPDIRYAHTAVWTGSEMIVWGGTNDLQSGGGFYGSGGRYDPATDSWGFTSLENAPTGRAVHAAVWTGSEMIVWGGQTDTGVTSTGGRYNPITDNWTPTSLVSAPAPRSYPTAVWTGSQMIVWGGSNLNTGGRYDPLSDTWTPTSTTGAPVGRSQHTAVWTGSEMIVWGGTSGVNDGGRYNPTTNGWAPVNTTNAPVARYAHTAVWTGSAMIIWGGEISVGAPLSTGGRYDPAANSWVATANAPLAASFHTAVWTGSEMIVWGMSAAGGRYDPSSNAWTPTTAVNAPGNGRSQHTAVWTGTEMIIWGGRYATGYALNSGARYRPAGDSWTATNPGSVFVPAPRKWHTVVWTGSEMIAWGGQTFGNQIVYTGAKYTPATGSWTPTSTTGAPSARYLHAAVWTGAEMIVWGSGAPATNTGGRYNPAANVWAPTSSTGAPEARSGHTAVWTGSRMIIWGGDNGGGNINTGGRYDPSTDVWTSTSTLNAPPGRGNPGSVWTGTDMIVWGGSGPGAVHGTSTGGRYNPVTNAWVATTTSGAPTGRTYVTLIWTGNRMLVWGGDAATLTNAGGRYDPATDAWTPTTTVGAPAARRYNSAVWTGIEMIVWGGETCTGACSLSTGGRYNPTLDRWTPTSTVSPPLRRIRPTAVWTGSEMVVWGGSPLSAGGDRYCACSAPQTFYGDTDGDGFGVPGANVVGCTGTPPPGYAATAGDCDDTRASVFPGAPQLCDGLNNDCTDPSWPSIPANEADPDNDGFRACAGDCDDARASVYPGAPQLCDGINNSCSDPGWPAVPANEADADQDGFRICQNDCNDASAAVHAGAVDVCNGSDDDCDAQIDDDAAGVDSDGDGVHNACDNCRFSPNPSQLDSDGDQVGNACDNCISAANSDQADSDGDGRGNACDNCPQNANVLQDDGDVDQAGDACDDCPFDFNPSQSDADHDGEGDVCDLNDGLIWEFREDKTSLSWQAEQGPTAWNAYIGDLGVLRSTGIYTQAPGSNPLAGRQCGLTSTFADDLAVPDPRQVSFSLVTGVQGGSEGSLGASTSGTRPNTNPCP